MHTSKSGHQNQSIISLRISHSSGLVNYETGKIRCTVQCFQTDPSRSNCTHACLVGSAFLCHLVLYLYEAQQLGLSLAISHLTPHLNHDTTLSHLQQTFHSLFIHPFITQTPWACQSTTTPPHPPPPPPPPTRLTSKSKSPLAPV